MKKIKYLPLFWTIAGVVAVYQLPLIENHLNQKNIITNINDYFPYSKDLQQLVENSKIYVAANFDNMLHKDIPIHTASLSNEMQTEQVIIEPVIEKAIIPTIREKVIIEPQIIIEPEVQIKNSYCETDCKVLMIGDSVMGDMEFSMIRLLKKLQPSWKVISGYKVSSGLTNQQYYDWPKTAEKLVSQYKPDYVFVLMGTNDAQNMIIKGKAVTFGKEAWVEEYQNRVNLISTNLDANTSYWQWVQLPNVKSGSFNKRLEIVRQAQQSTIGDKLLETDSLFGNSSENINMKLRANDGTHLNSAGANLLAQHAYEKLIKDTQ